MKISVDRAVCIGNGLCVAIAPEAFDLDDDGALVVLAEEDADLPEHLLRERKRLREAAASCPVGAIKLTE